MRRRDRDGERERGDAPIDDNAITRSWERL